MYEPEIRLGDCLDAMSAISDKSIDLVVADPPYNLGKDYGNKSDSQGKEEYLKFTQKWLSEATRVLKPSGSIYVFMGFRYISYLYVAMEDEFSLYFQNWISWHYTQGVGKKKGFSPRHDDILLFSKSKNPKFNLDDIRVPQKFYRSVNNMRGANPGDVWQFSHVHYCQESRTEHPTQKPEGLMERMVLASSDPGDWVLDPFAGSGSTLRVCQQLGRRSIGIEVNPEYVGIIQSRLDQPFNGFDSIDPRMKRIPNDLNDYHIRNEYRLNHKEWFLKNHQAAHEEFELEFENKYGHKDRQSMLFEKRKKYAT